MVVVVEKENEDEEDDEDEEVEDEDEEDHRSSGTWLPDIRRPHGKRPPLRGGRP